jgi:hypothetical protein
MHACMVDIKYSHHFWIIQNNSVFYTRISEYVMEIKFGKIF